MLIKRGDPLLCQYWLNEVVNLLHMDDRPFGQLPMCDTLPTSFFSGWLDLSYILIKPVEEQYVFILMSEAEVTVPN